MGTPAQSRRPSKVTLLGFFLVEFITVVATLFVLQLAGLESIAPGVAGFIGGVVAVLGSLVFWRTDAQKPNSA